MHKIKQEKDKMHVQVHISVSLSIIAKWLFTPLNMTETLFKYYACNWIQLNILDLGVTNQPSAVHVTRLLMWCSAWPL